jgi:hypothetical protein
MSDETLLLWFGVMACLTGIGVFGTWLFWQVLTAVKVRRARARGENVTTLYE